MPKDQNYIRKDSAADLAPLILLDALDNGGDSSRALQFLERAGQQQLVASAVMPTDVGGDRAAYEALGFTFGAKVDGDDMFTHCTLPDGWSKQGSDHDMWSYVVDQLGRRRVAVFYKAAFYDRSAFARLETPYGYLSHCLYEKTEPVLDDAWLTVDVATATLDAMVVATKKQVTEAQAILDRQPDRADYWSERIAEHAAEIAAMKALRDRIAATTK